jgi:hypothetical protein
MDEGARSCKLSTLLSKLWWQVLQNGFAGERKQLLVVYGLQIFILLIPFHAQLSGEYDSAENQQAKCVVSMQRNGYRFKVRFR